MSMPQPPADADAGVDFDRQPPVARVETDRFCNGCGYNLHTQIVRRDTRTGLLLCRCPECGQFHPVHEAATVGRVWLQRLGQLGLFVWIVVILWSGFMLGVAQIGATYIPLEERTVYTQITIETPDPLQPGSTVTQTRWRREARELTEHPLAFRALTLGISGGLGFVSALLIAVVLHHWPRWTYLLPVILVPLAAGLIAWWTWNDNCPHLGRWALPFVWQQGIVHCAGGVAGVVFGRPAARLVATLLLPPKLRQVLAFLWSVDGKAPPAAK